MSTAPTSHTTHHPAQAAQPKTEPDAAALAPLVRAIIEPLNEDESLRGDLTDDGFNALMQWANAAAKAYATKTLTSKPTASADDVQPYATRLKGVLQEAVADAQNGSIYDPKALYDFDGATPPAVPIELAAGDADANAVTIAAALTAAAQPQTDTKEEHPHI